MPGCGKTEVIKNIQTETDLILSFTNCGVQNVKDRCEFKNNIYTFDSFFNDHLSFEQKLKKVEEYDRIIVDEYSMVPVKFMNLLNTIKTKLNIPLLFFGDHNQCLSIETTGIIYDYSKTSTFTAMCNHKKYICSYKEQFSRYDLSLKNVLDAFIKDEEGVILDATILKQKKQKQNYINICRSSKMKWQIISDCVERFNEEYEFKTLQVEFKPIINKKMTIIKCDLSKDMKMMCGENMKDKSLFNGTVVDIIDITDDNKFIIKNGDKQHVFTVEEFHVSAFILSNHL
jgi:ATP-dependent exoDNAse (exonuclease V) alpha subunit